MSDDTVHSCTYPQREMGTEICTVHKTAYHAFDSLEVVKLNNIVKQ
jgi:hypothetical protein